MNSDCWVTPALMQVADHLGLAVATRAASSLSSTVVVGLQFDRDQDGTLPRDFQLTDLTHDRIGASLGGVDFEHGRPITQR